MDYVALQVKTSYSLLNSINDIKKLVSLAKEYGYTSLAISDENNMFGVMEFYYECKKNNIIPIIGIELSWDDNKILLYAKNNLGYKNLIKLSTIISSDNIDIDILKKYSDNLILVMPFSNYNVDIYNIYDDHFIGYVDIDSVKDIDEPKVFISDVRYLYKDDDIYLDYARMIRDGKVLGEYTFNMNSGHHLLNRDEVMLQVDDDSLVNYRYIKDNCLVSFVHQDNLLPIYNESIDSKSYLRNLANKGLCKRLNNNVPNNYQERLEYELDTIDLMGFNDYFLIVYDYVLYAKKNGIMVGPGRGSASGSLVSYTLGITDVDPIKYNLLFERFLNSQRVSMPDIDIDFDALRRDEVINYVINKYGSKKVIGIITFNTLGAKQVIRDVGRILNINSLKIDNMAKLAKKTLRESYQDSSLFRRLIDNSDELKKLYVIATHLEGLPRHISLHAAGVVMSRYDIDETIPLYKNNMGMYLSAYSKDYLEPLGLLKMDFLSLSNLTLIDEVIKNIQKDTKLNITFQNIYLDDKKTIDLFTRGDTDGVFQFESSGMIRFLQKFKVRNFSDIILAIALYRPGPMENIDEFIKRKEGKIKIDYIHPKLEDILKETYGIIVYQEQIMQIACLMAGYTLGEADNLRRAMSKKKEDILINEKDKFISGCLNSGYDIDVANRVYELILKFANYGFNKAHAVSYSIISYKMAFLKTHFYEYFMVSLLNNSINNQTKTNTYIALLRQNNISVLPPDINLSDNIYKIVDRKIICPLSIINNIGSVTVNTILRERSKGEFIDIIDFITRISYEKINKKVIQAIILSGALSMFGYNKKTLIYNLDNILNYVELSKNSLLINIEKPIIDNVLEYSKEELIEIEFKVFGFYLSYHPVSKYKDINSLNTLSISKYQDKFIELILEVNYIKEIVTKKGDVMAFVKAMDEFKEIELTLFPKVYGLNKEMEKYDIIKVNGRVEKRLDDYQIIVFKIINLTKENNIE